MRRDINEINKATRFNSETGRINSQKAVEARKRKKKRREDLREVLKELLSMDASETQKRKFKRLGYDLPEDANNMVVALAGIINSASNGSAPSATFIRDTLNDQKTASENITITFSRAEKPEGYPFAGADPDRTQSDRRESEPEKREEAAVCAADPEQIGADPEQTKADQREEVAARYADPEQIGADQSNKEPDRKQSIRSIFENGNLE